MLERAGAGRALASTLPLGPALPLLRTARARAAAVRPRRRSSALGLDVVRRPTGGRAVWHAEELTYALAVPAETLGGLRQRLRGDPSDAARRARAASASRAELAPARAAAAVDAGSCFASPAGGEIADRQPQDWWAARSSERARGLLQHGSILLAGRQTTVREVTLGGGPPDLSAPLAEVIGRSPAVRGGGGGDSRRRGRPLGRLLEADVGLPGAARRGRAARSEVPLTGVDLEEPDRGRSFPPPPRLHCVGPSSIARLGAPVMSWTARSRPRRGSCRCVRGPAGARAGPTRALQHRDRHRAAGDHAGADADGGRPEHARQLRDCRPSLPPARRPWTRAWSPRATGGFVPLLAKSWSRRDSLTLVFELEPARSLARRRAGHRARRRLHVRPGARPARSRPGWRT